MKVGIASNSLLFIPITKRSQPIHSLFIYPPPPLTQFNTPIMASAGLTANPQDLATFIKHNPPCDAQGVIQREEIPDSPTSPNSSPSHSHDEEEYYSRHTYRTSRYNTTIICADPRITEDLLVILKDATEEQPRVEKIEVHEIYI